MSNLGRLIDDMQAESLQPGEQAAFRRHIGYALNYYRPRRFLFSEKSQTVDLVAGRSEYKPGGETVVTPGYTYLDFPDDYSEAEAFVDLGSGILVPGTESFGVAVRFRIGDQTAKLRTLVSYGTGANPFVQDQWAINIGTSGELIADLVSPTISVTDASADYRDGQWHWVGMAVDRTNDSIWLVVDGSLVTTFTEIGSSASIDPVGRLIFGGFDGEDLSNNPEVQNQYLGDIERVVHFSVAPTVAEFQGMMDWEPGEEVPKLVNGFWPMNEGEGTIVEDLVPAGLTGLGPGPTLLPEDTPGNDGTLTPAVDWASDTATFSYDFPGDIMDIDSVERMTGSGVLGTPLKQKTIAEMRSLQSTGIGSGPPDYWCWHHDRFIIYPTPSGTSSLRIDYHFDATRNEANGNKYHPRLSVGRFTNEFFRRGFTMLMSRALYTFALGRDDDYELAKRMKILNIEEESSLGLERDIMKVDGQQAESSW